MHGIHIVEYNSRLLTEAMRHSEELIGAVDVDQ